jgi:hypothetical protein
MGRRKQKRIWLLVALFVGVSGIYLYFDFRDFLGLTTLSLADAERAWGTKEFNSKQFKNGSKQERAAQTTNLIRSHEYFGKDLKTVISELGPHDGYYNSDEIPDYSLGELNGDHWELVFLPDENGRVTRIIIHKECCYHGILNLFIR